MAQLHRKTGKRQRVRALSQRTFLFSGLGQMGSFGRRTIHIDPRRLSFEWLERRLVLAAEIDVLGNGFPISDGDTSPRTADGTDFGTVDVDGQSQPHRFTKGYRPRKSYGSWVTCAKRRNSRVEVRLGPLPSAFSTAAPKLDPGCAGFRHAAPLGKSSAC
jgi:hypothetical protein